MNGKRVSQQASARSGQPAPAQRPLAPENELDDALFPDMLAQTRQAEARPAPTISGVIALQRVLGNQVVQRLLAQRDPDADAGAAAAPAAAPAASWDFDPNKLLDQPEVNPEFRAVATAALTAAVAGGFHPQIFEVYRTPEESDRRYIRYKAGGTRAAPAWASLHNYGLAMDVYIKDERNRLIEAPVPGWYGKVKKFAQFLVDHNLVWGEPINDSDHFEYHPTWAGLAGGDLLKSTQKWAMDIAEGVADATKTDVDWMPYFWWAAGAGGAEPATPEGGEP